MTDKLRLPRSAQAGAVGLGGRECRRLRAQATGAGSYPLLALLWPPCIFTLERTGRPRHVSCRGKGPSASASIFKYVIPVGMAYACQSNK